MKKLLYISLFLLPIVGLAQSFSPEKQREIDSLNAIIANTNNHDTSLAGAYVSLSELFYYSNNTDTAYRLGLQSDSIITKALPKYKDSGLILHSLKLIHGRAFNLIGAILGQKANYQKSKEYLLKARKLQEETKDYKNLSATFYNLGIRYIDLDSINLAIKALTDSYNLQIKLGDSIGLGYSLDALAQAFHFQGNNLLHFKYSLSSLKIREKINDKRGMAISYSNIGFTYSEQGKDSLALEYYLKSLEIRKTQGDKHGEASIYNKIGWLYKKQENYSKALEYYYKNLEIHKEIGAKDWVVSTHRDISFIHDKLGNISEAKNHLLLSLNLAKEIGQKREIMSSYINLGHFTINNFLELNLLKREAIHLAENYGKEALRIANEIKYPAGIMRSARLLAIVYKEGNKWKSYAEMRDLEINMKDSLNNEEAQKTAIQQQAKYEYEKQKAIDDAEHEKQLVIEQDAKEKQQILTYATGAGLGLVGIFLVFVFNRLKITRKQKGIIEEAHAELGEKNQEILDSIKYAKRIQNAILPPNKVVKEYLQKSFILYKPKDIVAGDFYWLESVPGLGENDGQKILFAAADCTGHGVPGAMVSVVCNNGLNRSVREYGLTDPGEILNKTREIVVQEFEKSEEDVKDGMDIAICSLEGNTLQYAGAHNPLWILRNGELLETKANKQPIGQFDNPEPYTTHTIELQKGDSIYIFSDGYADQFGGEKGKKLKTANFKKLLLSIQKENMTTQKQLIDEAFENWKGSLEQLDDVCVIGVKI